jgi:hypothetical protein
MTRFFRTAYATSLVSMLLTLITTVATGVHVPFLSFSCLLGGLLVCLLPQAVPSIRGRERLFLLLGLGAALLGFLPILLTRCPLFHFISYGVSVAAAAILLALLRHNTTNNNFKARFSLITIIVFCLVLYFVVSATTMRRVSNSIRYAAVLDPERVRLALHDVIPYAIVLLATGVLCLRGLRAQNGASDERSFQRRQLRDALLFFGTVSVAFVVLPLLKPLWEYLLNNVLAPFARLLAGLTERAVTEATKPGGHSQGFIPAATTAPGTTAGPVVPIGDVSDGSGSPQNGTPPPAGLRTDTLLKTLLFLVIIAIVVTLAAYFLLKALRRWKRYERSYPNESREALPETETPKKEAKPAKHSADPRRRMRYLYASFLKQLRKTTAQRTRTAEEDDASVDPHVWGEMSGSGYSWMRSRMGTLPEYSASYSYLHVKDEGIANERAATFMKWFDRRSKKRKPDGNAAQFYQTSTCGEIRTRAETMLRADEADLAAFTAYYERARYQLNESPSQEDAARMTELLGRIHSDR